MSGLAWLNELMVWLGKWFPRLVLINATHEGVKFTRHGGVGAFPPGLYCYWPITTDFKVVSTRRRTTEIAAQLIGQEVVSVAIAFTIQNPKDALMAYDDVFAQLDDRTQAHLSALHAINSNNAQLGGAVRAAVAEEFEENGVLIHSVDVIQRGRVIPVKTLTDWAQHSKAEL